MDSFSILIGKLISFLVRTVLNRNASTWPGHVALQIDPNFIKKILKKNSDLKIILIAGTNGKTTTTKAIYHILKNNNVSVIRNEAGANLLNGLASLLVNNSSTFGKLSQEALLFEVDENSLPLILKFVNPTTVVLLNLFRDQLDRYGEVNATSEKWAEAIRQLDQNTKVIANADDPQIAKIASNANTKSYYYSVPDKLKMEGKLSHAVDSTTCPKCRNDLSYSKISYSHLGNFKCDKCGFTNPKSENMKIQTDLKGVFNIYNLTAAALASTKTFNIPVEKVSKSIIDFKPAFGRQEEISYRNKKVIMLLSKNPTGFNESLKIVKENKYSNLLIVLNDRIPDGRDISWIWDVDFEILSNKYTITVSGDRAYDLGNRLRYSEIKSLKIEKNLNDALNTAIDKTSESQPLVVLPTYSAMLETRKILTGKSIL